MQGLVLMVIVLVVISTVVGTIAKLLNNLAEANATRRAEEERRARIERAERNAERARAAQDERAERPARALPANTGDGHNGGSVRPASSEMDRFLAEIDRLRRKATPAEPSAQPGTPAPVTPVVQPIKPAVDRPRPRVIAELAEQPQPPADRGAPSSGPSFGTSPQAPTRAAPVAAQIEELPVASVLRTTSTTGAPATKVTVLSRRPRPAAKTNFGKNLTALLGSGQGVAMAVVLQEILGPPKAKKNANAEKQTE